MKISDYIFRFPASGFTKHEAICRVRVFVGLENRAYVVLTDLGEKNTGSSVTNSVEVIRLNLVAKGHIADDASVVEHYDKEYPEGGSFDFVTFDDSNSPSWSSANLDKSVAHFAKNRQKSRQF